MKHLAAMCSENAEASAYVHLTGAETPLDYDHDFGPAEPLVCIDDRDAAGLLVQGKIYHFARYANQSTIHVREVSNLGKVGFAPRRFTKWPVNGQ